MSGDAPTNRVPHLWAKVALLMGGVAVGELGFLIFHGAGVLWAGIVALCVGVVVVVAAMWWVIRDSKRMRAAGYKADFPQIEQRMRRHLKWGALFVALSVVTTVVLVTTDRPKDQPLWPIILGPVILIVGLAWLWLVLRFLLPWERRRQQARDSRA